MIYQKIICINCAFSISELDKCPITFVNSDAYFDMGATLFGVSLLPKREIFDWIIKHDGKVILDCNQRQKEGVGELIIQTDVILPEKDELLFKLLFEPYREIIIQ
jgi:hypothetical protein